MALYKSKISAKTRYMKAIGQIIFLHNGFYWEQVYNLFCGNIGLSGVQLYIVINKIRMLI